MFSCINSFRMYNNLLNKSIIKFKNRKLKSVRIFLSGVKIFLAKKVYAIPGVIQTAKIWFQNSFMFVKFPFHGHPRSFHCSVHYYRSVLWRSMTKWFLMWTWPIVNCTGLIRTGLGAGPFGPGLFEIIHLGKVQLRALIRGRGSFGSITCLG